MLDKFPVKDKVITSLGFLNPNNSSGISSASILYLWHQLVQNSTPQEMDSLLTELQEFKSLPDIEVPSTCDQGNNYAWLDHFWAKVSTMSRPEDSSLLRFPSLGKLAKISLVLPHSNADPKRLFSMVKKVETSLHGHLKTSQQPSTSSV